MRLYRHQIDNVAIKLQFVNVPFVGRHLNLPHEHSSSYLFGLLEVFVLVNFLPLVGLGQPHKSEDFGQLVGNRISAKKRLFGEQFVEDAADGPNVDGNRVLGVWS